MFINPSTDEYFSLPDGWLLSMFYYTVWGKGLDDLEKRFASIEEAIYWAIDDPLPYGELMDLLEY